MNDSNEVVKERQKRPTLGSKLTLYLRQTAIDALKAVPNGERSRTASDMILFGVEIRKNKLVVASLDMFAVEDGISTEEYTARVLAAHVAERMRQTRGGK